MKRKNNTEVLAPAGSPESLTAAVRAGADAVYLGASSFSARAGAHNFSREELSAAVRFCHERGVRVHLAVNILLRNDELPAALDLIRWACTLPVDAVLVQDPGLLSLLRRCCPKLPLHASTQMSIHTPAGVRACLEAGFSRVVLSRELSLPEIREIRRACPQAELESFVHGALCMSVSGQCWFSAILGRRSGNRGQCAQPCRLPFAAPGGTGHDLSLKDLSMIPRLQELSDAGIDSFKIEGRMKRPEYVAAATRACRLAADGEPLPPQLLQDLHSVFSRSGFTTGYPDGRLGREMFGTRSREDTAQTSEACSRLRGLYRRELSRIPVAFLLTVQAGKPVLLQVRDIAGNTAVQSADPPQPARSQPLTEPYCIEHLQKTGGTPFYAKTVTCQIDEGLSLPAAVLNHLRRDALAQLLAKRGARRPVPFTPVPFAAVPHKAAPLRLRARFPDGNVPKEAALCESILVPYDLPLSELQTLNQRGLSVVLELPRGMFGTEEPIRTVLRRAAGAGFYEVWAGTLNSAALAKELGLTLHGGFSLNVTNSAALRWYTEFGLSDTELSFELTLHQAAEIGGELPRGLLIYGRLPLMLTRNCPIANGGGCRHCKTAAALTDRKGIKFPVQCFGGCSEVLNSVPLSLLGRLGELSGREDFGMLRFTTETPEERAHILQLAAADRPLAGSVTHGLYDRGVI
ncbi:MAG: U32 family peptidase [Oscillospiraceae bacterium]|nr:U32 family peptidase [Oscillospiraceae bacterium]